MTGEHKRAKAARALLDELLALGVELPAAVPSTAGVLARAPGRHRERVAAGEARDPAAPLRALLDERRRRRAAERVAAGIEAAASALALPTEALLAELALAIGDEPTARRIESALAALTEALAPSVVAPLGRLVAELVAARRDPLAARVAEGFAHDAAALLARLTDEEQAALARALASATSAGEGAVRLALPARCARLLAAHALATVDGAHATLDRDTAARLARLLAP